MRTYIYKVGVDVVARVVFICLKNHSGFIIYNRVFLLTYYILDLFFLTTKVLRGFNSSSSKIAFQFKKTQFIWNIKTMFITLCLFSD